MGETKISWLKSFSRSSIRLMTPIAADCHRVWARTPVKTKVRMSNPLTSPKPACRLVPRTPMMMSGKVKSAISRVRSRSSLTRSRCAIAMTAETSCIALWLRIRLRVHLRVHLTASHDLEVRVVEARHVRLYDAQWGVNRLQHGVRSAAVELDPE